MARKVLGVNFLERHNIMAKEIGLDSKHVIVDKRDYQALVSILTHSRIDIDKLINENNPISGLR